MPRQLSIASVASPSPKASASTRGALLAVWIVAAAAGCAQRTIPDPRVAARQFGDAAARGDAAAVYAMLTADARRQYGVDGTRRLLADSREEIVRRALAMGSSSATVRSMAEVTYVDGERAVLEIDDGRFRVSSASGLPAAARTPSEALDQLRTALAMRSYPALIRVLSTDTQGALESDLRALVEGLEHPEALDVKVRGDSAEVTVAGGHKVLLKRESGIWRVRDFD